MENVNQIVSGYETRKALTTMVRFAVCNVEQITFDIITDKLREYYPDECEIKTYIDGASLLSQCRWSCFDALFLDIDMPESNGMEIAEKIREIGRRVKIIFVSNKNELAYKGYLYNAFRFVRKSNLEQDLCEAVKGLNESFSTQNDYLVFKTSKGEAIRAVKDIRYFEVKTHFINVVCNDGDIRIYGTLREYEEQIGNNGLYEYIKAIL